MVTAKMTMRLQTQTHQLVHNSSLLISTLHFTTIQKKISSTIKKSQNIMNMFVDKGTKHNKTQILSLINQINEDETKGLKKLFHNIEVYFKRNTSECTK